MKIIIGLGNPGHEYISTRHNVGFLMIEHLRKVWDFSAWKATRFSADVSEGVYEYEKVLLIKPTTFMNLSGNAVSKIVHFYHLALSDLLVISDDIDMEFAKVRFRAAGSSGGQKGIDSIIKSLGGNDFGRVKVGIGRDPHYTVSDWVLSRFSDAEKDILETSVFPLIRTRAESFVTGKSD